VFDVTSGLCSEAAPPKKKQKGHSHAIFGPYIYCGQTVGWMKMKLGMQVGVGFGHIVLNRDPAPPPPKGHSHPIFGPYLLWPNG